MNKDDIIRMAGQVDAVTKVLLDRKEPQGMNHETFVWFLERFAKLVADAEREACARICETEWSTTQEHVHGLALADMIRARGQA